MNCLLIAVSHLKSGAEKQLFDQYNVRLQKPMKVIEVKQHNLPQKEALDILAIIQKEDWVCALDERGETCSSRQLSDVFKKAEISHKRLVFIIGGADGLDQSVRDRANYLLSFGKMTWPHLLVRSLLTEQIYRSQQIQANHPYHRD